MSERLWRSHGACRLETQPKTLQVVSEWVPVRDAQDHLWNCRRLVKGKGWWFWIEPQDMTDDERNKYIPCEFEELRKIEEPPHVAR